MTFKRWMSLSGFVIANQFVLLALWLLADIQKSNWRKLSNTWEQRAVEAVDLAKHNRENFDQAAGLAQTAACQNGELLTSLIEANESTAFWRERNEHSIEAALDHARVAGCSNVFAIVYVEHHGESLGLIIDPKDGTVSAVPMQITILTNKTGIDL